MNKNDASEWLNVPCRIPDLYVKYAADTVRLLKENPDAAEIILETKEVGPVIVKRAKGTFFPTIGAAMRGAQVPIGGPNPLTAMLLGAALGAGGGALANQVARFFWPKYLRDDSWKRWAILGALGGAAIPGVVHGAPNVWGHGIKGLLKPSPYQGGPRYPEPEPEPEEPVSVKTSGSVLSETLNRILDEFGYDFASEPLEKAAFFDRAHTINNINAGDWMQVVGRDPFLVPEEKAVIAGLPMAAAASRGSTRGWISPYDVGRVAAQTALGGAYGTALGRLISPVLGLTDEAQRGIQQAGLLAGAVRAINTQIRN
jgi:hypothetical protein